jgi:hypothetical protein
MKRTINAVSSGVHMYTKTAVMGARSVLGAAAVVCALFAGNVAAKDHQVIVRIHVSTQGLDLSQPAGAHEFYTRNRVDLKPSPDPVLCYEKALGDAIRSANVLLVTQVYLATHTLREAAARGIDVPAQMAAK